MVSLVDASAEPDGELVKAVHAYFGLCMYFAQVFETQLINLLTVLEAIARKPKTQRDYTIAFDALYAKHESLTFGNLLKALATHKVLPHDVLLAARDLKDKHDYIAHRFFRDHSLDELTIGGCHTMIEELEESRAHFMELDSRVTAIENDVYEKLGISSTWIKSETKRLTEEMRKEAVAQRCSRVAP